MAQSSFIVELLHREANEFKAEPSAAVSSLFLVAESLGYLRRVNNELLTTTLLFFAAVGASWPGRANSPDAQELRYLNVFADVVRDTVGRDTYEKWQSEYFLKRPDFSGLAPAKPLKDISPNTREALRRALRRAAGRQLTADMLLMELLGSPSARINENLKNYRVTAEQLLAALDARLRQDMESETNGPAQQDTPDTPLSPMPQTTPPQPRNYISSFQNDDPRNAADDFIKISDEVEALARLAASRKVAPPVSIAVFGDWGSGKTFFMERMHARVQALTAKSHGAFFEHIVQIRFNAWHYIETNLWASLVEYIFNELDAWLRAKDIARSKVDALFDQLATSRQIKLDAYRDLVAIRGELRKAEKALETAQADYDQAVQASATRPLENAWPTIAEAFGEELTRSERDQLRSAVDALGMAEIQESAAEVAELVDRTREQAVRTQVIGNALVTRLGSRDAVVAAGSILAAPVLVIVAIGLMAAVSDSAWVKNLNAGVLAAVSSVSAALLVVRKWVNIARQGLDRLDVLRAKLDQKAAEATERERRSLAEADANAEHARQAAAEAELRVAAAREREAAARQDYQSETARGRLNRFIRAKVADASYAKHLGIVASIRKDFGQLSMLMSQEAVEASINADVRKAEELHLKKVEALIADAKKEGLLEDTEIADLQENKKDAEEASFERIVLYIDDLDRCPPDKVVDVLQAIHMLLYFPLFVVVVAVDVRWVSRSLNVRFPKLLTDRLSADAAALEGSAADAQDYLEKIFQIPFWVRRMDGISSADFVSGLAKKFLRPEGPKDKDELQKVVVGKGGGTGGGTGALPGGPSAAPPSPGAIPIGGNPSETGAVDPPGFDPMMLASEELTMLSTFAPFVGGSPRRAKRYVNLYLLLRSILPSESVPQQWAIAALLAVATGNTRSDGILVLLQSKPKTLGELAGTIKSDPELAKNRNGSAAVDALIAAAREGIDEGALIGALKDCAPTVRRYSFW